MAGMGENWVKQSNLFDIPDRAWALPESACNETQPPEENGECEFGISQLNECVVRASELRFDFGQFQMEHTFPSLFVSGSIPRWTLQSSGARMNFIRLQYLSTYAYLALRAQSHPELRGEVAELRKVMGAGFDGYLRSFAPEVME